MSADGGLVFDGMGRFLMPRIRVIQRSDSRGAEYSAEDCMSNLASSSSDDKADDAMYMASGSGPRTCLSCFSFAFHIPFFTRPLRPSIYPARVDLAVLSRSVPRYVVFFVILVCRRLWLGAVTLALHSLFK